MVSKLNAIMDRVIIKLDPDDEKTKGGVLLTEESVTSKTTGRVMSIGEQVRSIKVGDRVFFHEFDELPTLQDGVVIVRERSLLAKINE